MKTLLEQAVDLLIEIRMIDYDGTTAAEQAYVMAEALAEDCLAYAKANPNAELIDEEPMTAEEWRELTGQISE